MPQTGNRTTGTSATVTGSSMNRSIRWHRSSTQFSQALSAHGSENRKRAPVPPTASARSTKSGVKGRVGVTKLTRPSAPTIPSRLAPSLQRPLGQTACFARGSATELSPRVLDVGDDLNPLGSPAAIVL
jgi:hypothetical protein